MTHACRTLLLLSVVLSALKVSGPYLVTLLYHKALLWNYIHIRASIVISCM